MKERVISAIVALIIAIPIIILGGVPYYIATCILALIGYYELLKVRENEKKISIYVKVLSAIAYLLLIHSIEKFKNNMSLYLVAGLAIFMNYFIK